MKRRRAILVMSGSVLGGLAGCTRPGRGVSRRDVPRRPERLNVRSAVEFAIAYEEAYGYNEHIAGRDELVSFSYQCEGAFDAISDGAYFVVVGCGFSETSERDGARSAGEGLTDPIVYFLTDGDSVRVPTVSVRTETGSNSNAPHGIRLVNFSDSDRTVDVELTYDGPESDREADAWYSEASYLAARSGETIERLTGPEGVYTVTVTLDGGSTQTHAWAIPGEPGPDIQRGWSRTNVNLGVYITPTGGLRIHDLTGP